ncbi:FKBP-type peptidyl-prolyl cis-trans isomerase [Rickettsiella endosymbiont of Dermanyssus gallinae]|uniref:FKBP-type peptidyl-prolyl cis-trans isomerase N-terminal domain-containing protein n=1 Tax=Rickettsiella endosymbiont of Dermanyssus gallinae TaxID=2856608 RepID=UPI001C52B9D7|nr:FKBP-type peptidyl-prolyl cis-trans isomerase [Rickettsiella endosymbiont of Dermanyssus gallinae]
MTRLSVLSTLTASLIVSSSALAAQTTPPSAVNQLGATSQHISSTSTPSKAQISYSIGADLGENFKEQGIDIDPAELAHGLKDATLGKTSLSQAQMVDILKNFQQQLIAKKETEFKTVSDKNKQQGDTFLASNKAKPGIITTKSGMQYKIVNAGNGEAPSDNSMVKVMYTGKFIDGTIFDKSKDPVTFPINNVIPGWTEVLKLMKPGAEFEVAIPPQLAYGEHGVDKAIGPNQTLLFTIHLLEVKKSDSKSA